MQEAGDFGHLHLEGNKYKCEDPQVILLIFITEYFCTNFIATKNIKNTPAETFQK